VITPEQVESTVTGAFSDTPHPEERIVSNPSHWEAAEIQNDFKGKHWRDIIDPTFLREHRTLYYFSPGGFRYYLPAYLIGLLRFPTEAVEWSDEVLVALYPPAHSVNTWLPRWDERMKVLDPVQKRAVRLFLEYLLATEPELWRTTDPPGNELELALANYWSQF
jgi:hypothetical protein